MHATCSGLLSTRLERCHNMQSSAWALRFSHMPVASERGSGLGFSSLWPPGPEALWFPLGRRREKSKLGKKAWEEATADRSAGILGCLTLCSLFCALTMGSGCSLPFLSVLLSPVHSLQPTHRDHAYQCCLMKRQKCQRVGLAAAQHHLILEPNILKRWLWDHPWPPSMTK